MRCIAWGGIKNTGRKSRKSCAKDAKKTEEVKEAEESLVRVLQRFHFAIDFLF
jgi:hypothetical protein